MTVYITEATRPQGLYMLATMIADTEKELHAMANAIGVDPAWCNGAETTDARYYVSSGQRVRVIKRKAVEISAEQCRAMRWHRHHHAELGKPAAALERFTQHGAARAATESQEESNDH